jgi:formate-dependent nitrite reductase cytochrome c552 subunit
MACHLEEGVTKKGEKIMKASAKSCVMCHKGRKGLLKDWKTELSKEVQYTQKVEKEALKALAVAKAKFPKPKKQLAEAREMLKKGQETLNMVRLGNGVHNKKYSMFLLDVAITNFEDLKDSLEEAE